MRYLNMTKIKICGIRRKEDIQYVNKFLPDYIGFIFAKGKRQVTSVQVKELCQELNSRIKKVGVFVNEEVDKVVRIAEECGLSAVQVHGDETPEYIEELRGHLTKINIITKGNVEIWKAFRVKDKDTINEMSGYKADVFVLDAYTDSSYGGSGKTFDWNLAVEAKKYGKIVLAGGINVKNASNAIEIVNPWAVDVSSGVETEGFKDEEKIRDFIATIQTLKNRG